MVESGEGFVVSNRVVAMESSSNSGVRYLSSGVDCIKCRLHLGIPSEGGREQEMAEMAVVLNKVGSARKYT